YSSFAPARRAFYAIYFLDFFVADLLPRVGWPGSGYHPYDRRHGECNKRSISCVIVSFWGRGGAVVATRSAILDDAAVNAQIRALGSRAHLSTWRKHAGVCHWCRGIYRQQSR